MAKKKKPTLGLPVVPPKGSPFLGISHTNAPARNTKIPNLTAQVTLAKTRKAALTHGGLLTPEQQQAASDAGKALAAHKQAKKAAVPNTRTPQTAPKASAKKPLSDSTPKKKETPRGGLFPATRRIEPSIASAQQEPTSQRTLPRILPLPSTAPFRVPLPTAPAPSLASPSPGRRGNPRLQMQQNQPHQSGGLLSQVGDYLSGPALGKTGAAAVAHAIDVGAGTTIAALGPSALSDVKHPIAAAQAIKKRGLVTTQQASADLATRLGKTGVTGSIPKDFSIPSIDLVQPAGAAITKKAITKDELAQLEAQGVDLKPRLKTRFTKQALKNGWNTAELDGLSGSALIDKAFTHPPNLALRVLGNTAKGVAQLGTLPAGVEGAIRETAAGHGGDVAKALGEGLISELPIVGKHPFGQTLVADPFGTLTQFAGAGKTVGSLTRLGRAGRLAGAERIVKSAASGREINRGAVNPNAYVATGNAISDAAARRIPALSGRLEAKQVDTLVRSAVNKHAPEYVAVQRPYKAALDKVGNKRAAELQAYQQAGGKPEQLAAFYRAQGEKAPAKFYDRVAANTKALTPEDQTFLDAHAALTQKTTQALMQSGKFSDTAAAFRRYSPLIRSSAHLGDPEAQRILALRDEYIKGFNTMPEQDVAALRGAIDQGVQDFATKHTASGGIEPAYVAYGKPKPVIASPFTPSAGGTIGFKTPKGRQKVETGASFESGKYLIDPASPLAENVRAQRQHLASVLHEDVSKAVGTHLTAGDPIPAGHVFVSETNLRGLRRTTNDLVDNPVSAPDFYAEEAGVRQKLYDHLSANAAPSGERVPRGEKGYAIPEAAWKRILDHTRPPSRSNYAKAMRQYQRVLVSYRPSTIVNNTLGSIPLALTGGAMPLGTGTHVLGGAWRDAARAMHEPSLAPAVLRSHGVAGSFAPSVRSHVGAGLDFMRAQSAKGEDFSRLATFFSKAGPTIKRRARELNQTTDEYARAFAAGKIDEPLLNQALDHTEQFIGDMLKPDGPLARKAGNVILFHNWVGHIAKLLLYTLPVNHPRRLQLLLTLSKYGEQYRQENGVWPDWYREYLPLFQHVERIGKAGVPQTFTKTFSMTGVNPFSTINNLANPVSTQDSAKSILSGLAAPPIQIAFNTIANRPYDSTSVPRYVAGQALRQVPGVSVVRPQGGMASDSIPFFSERRKVYSSGKKRHGKTVPLPYDFRPTARAESGILGALLRYGLGGVYDVPAQGPIHNIDQGKHIGAVAKAARRGG